MRPQITMLTSDGECVSVEVFADGKSRGAMCVADAVARGLTILDLTDEWTPTIFAPTRDGQTPAFRSRYLDLAAEKAIEEPGAERAFTPAHDIDSLAELYGIVPAAPVSSWSSWSRSPSR
jgi:hypothetical protein